MQSLNEFCLTAIPQLMEISIKMTITLGGGVSINWIYVTVHGKTYVNDLSLKRKNQRTTNEQRTNIPNVSTNYPNVPSIWSEKYERAKIHTIF